MNNGKTNKNKSKINKKEAVTSTNGSRRGTKAGMLRPVLNLLMQKVWNLYSIAKWVSRYNQGTLQIGSYERKEEMQLFF